VGLPNRLKSRQLPHLNADRSICYLDQEVSTIFPLPPSDVITDCIDLVERVVHGWDTGDNDDEVQAEFSAYWSGEALLFRLTEDSVSDVWKIDRTDTRGNKKTEFVIANNKSIVETWLARRGGESSCLLDSSVILIDASTPFSVPHHTIWPPSSFKEVIDWLDETNLEAAKSLTDHLVKHIKEDHNGFLVELRHDSESIVFKVATTPGLRNAFQRARSFNRRKTSSAKKKAKYPSSLKICMRNNLMTRSFHRYWLEDVRESFIYTRNEPEQQTLGGLRIALIGCGTLGGYTAQTLAHCGAGTQNGALHLFDNDFLSSGNLGRHLLGINYLHDNKAAATTQFLVEQHLYLNLYAHETKFTELDFGKKFDLIIDATGNEPFSVLLAKWFRDRYGQITTNRPTLIHGWIDAQGKAARAFRDDATAACYACLCDFKAEGNGALRLPLYRGNPPTDTPYRRSCGSTYLPYPSQASLTGAGLIQRMALTRGTGINFRQLTLDPSIQDHREKRIEPTQGCPACSP